MAHGFVGGTKLSRCLPACDRRQPHYAQHFVNCFIRGGAIGDFVLTLPALKAIREAFPQAHFEILGYRHIVALADHRFYADATRSLEDGKLARFFAADAELPSELCDYFASFDLIVSYLFDPDSIFERNVKRCSKARFLPCFTKIDGAENAAIQLAHPLEELGLTATDFAPRLYPSKADRVSAASIWPTDGAIAIHPGSGSQSKNWPIEHWLGLIKQLSAKRSGTPLLIIGGEDDVAPLTTLRAAVSEQARFLTNLPLVELAAVLERCSCFIGHDSGISHIAAAVGTPMRPVVRTDRPRSLGAGIRERPRRSIPHQKDARHFDRRSSRRRCGKRNVGRYELMRIGIST